MIMEMLTAFIQMLIKNQQVYGKKIFSYATINYEKSKIIHK